MNQRTRACVRRMKLGDICSLPEHLYRRALLAFDKDDQETVNSIYGLRLRYIQNGLHPVYGTSWKSTDQSWRAHDQD